MGPEVRPPSERFEYSWPSARAAWSVHCICGASMFRLEVRATKLVPERVRRLKLPPLKPPRDTSYGDVTREPLTAASRGKSLPLKFCPLSVVEFWSGESPSTENPDGSPSAPGTSSTPGSDAAMAAKSPSWLAARAEVLTARSVPEMSVVGSLRPARSRDACTRTASSVVAERDILESATRISSSATLLISNRRAAYPMAAKFTK